MGTATPQWRHAREGGTHSTAQKCPLNSRRTHTLQVTLLHPHPRGLLTRNHMEFCSSGYQICTNAKLSLNGVRGTLKNWFLGCNTTTALSPLTLPGGHFKYRHTRASQTRALSREPSPHEACAAPSSKDRRVFPDEDFIIGSSVSQQDIKHSCCCDLSKLLACRTFSWIRYKMSIK